MFRYVDRKSLVLISLITLLLAYLPSLARSEVNDQYALTGVSDAKAVFDIQLSKPEKFAFYLEVISKTHKGIVDQGGHPEFVVAVRGPSIRYISKETWSFSEEDLQYLETSARLIKDLKSRGVRFEACSIAAGLFKVDHQTYLAAVDPVGNTLISLIGYQAQGYGLVPIY
ncbi:DsrE family protein [Desulfopila sp. IMCC35008]|uniref:DsrE family protein n=1 Tax=Desulfopila sp. IMCC35008 TaxID=2653858 RepID=UPI0013D59B8F|nr:DsrE family protein [Desulfopila sp. IMCC35008]